MSWAKDYDRCRVCKKTDYPLYSQGFCTHCIYQAKKKGLYVPGKKITKKIRTKDGVVQHLCPYCTTWKEPEAFEVRDTSTGRGVRCRLCRRAAQRAEYYADREHYRAKRQAQHAKHRVSPEVLRAEKHRRKVDPLGHNHAAVPNKILAGWLKELRELVEQEHPTNAAETVQVWTKLSARAIYRIEHNENQSGGTSWDIAERIARASGHEQELAELIAEPGLEGWSNAGNRMCVKCGTWERPHFAKGYCLRCYSVRRYHTHVRGRANEPPIAKIEGRWSRWWITCRLCKKTKFRHKGRGLCASCYQKILWAAVQQGRNIAATFDGYGFTTGSPEPATKPPRRPKPGGA